MSRDQSQNQHNKNKNKKLEYSPQPSTVFLFSAFCVGKPLQLSPVAACAWPRPVLHERWSLLVRSESAGARHRASICSQPQSHQELHCRHSMCRYSSFQIQCIIIWSEFRRRSWSCASCCTPWCSAGDSTSLSTGSSVTTSSLSNKDWQVLFCFVFVWFGQVKTPASCRI